MANEVTPAMVLASRSRRQRRRPIIGEDREHASFLGVATREEGGLRRGAAELSRGGEGQAEAARDQDDAAVDPESLPGFLLYVAFERFVRGGVGGRCLHDDHDGLDFTVFDGE